jgi:hypothetical protein
VFLREGRKVLQGRELGSRSGCEAGLRRYDLAMKSCLLCLFSLPLVVVAQPGRGVLLPEARTVRGVVVDEVGAVVAKARIQHARNTLESTMTDGAGRFAVWTRAPQVVVRKDGYESVAVRTKEAGELRVLLRRAGEAAPYPTCDGKGEYYGLGGWGLRGWLFPSMEGIEATERMSDVDYVARRYRVKTEAGYRGIQHAGGALWGGWLPHDKDVWESLVFEEKWYRTKGGMIHDARGQKGDGSLWRHLRMFGESAYYEGVDERTAKILDAFLDRGCVAK